MRHHRLDEGEHIPLDLFVFDDGFDDEADGCKVAEVGARPKPGNERRCLVGFEPSPLHISAYALPQLGEGVAHRFGVGVVQVDDVAGPGGNASDPGPHRAGADDAHGLIRRQRPRAHRPLKRGGRFSRKAATPSR